MTGNDNERTIASLYKETLNDYEELLKGFRSIEKKIEQKAKEIFNHDGKASVELLDTGDIGCSIQLPRIKHSLEQINIFADAMEQPYDEMDVEVDEDGLFMCWELKTKQN